MRRLVSVSKLIETTIPVNSRFFSGENLYNIVDTNSGKCLHIRGASVNNRTPVWTWSCNEVKDKSHAIFKLIPTGSRNTYYIQDQNSRKCLHVRGASHELRSPLWTWNCNEIESKEHAMFKLIEPSSLYP